MENRRAIVATLVAILFLHPSVHQSGVLVFLHMNHVLQPIVAMHVSYYVCSPN